MPDRQATAMLDCEDGETEANSNCKHCQASGDQQRYWDIQLDQDLLETICGIYPEWFKECNMNLGSENNNNTTADLKLKQEETSQKAIDKNKESLKVKLMLRRPFNQLVDQGIIPSLKSSPSFHESRQKLERAKMGDILKHKIQKRPDRQELIQQHILEDSCADSSLQDQQRQQKRARLSEGLTERLSQRTSGLELVKVNILHADEILAQAVREGGLQFHGSCDTPSPQFRLGPDDDSGSDGTFSPSPPYDCNEHSQGSLPSLDANESSPNPNQGSPCSAGAFSMSPPSSASSPLSILPAVVSPQSEQIFDYMVHMQHGKEHVTPNKNRKKTKPKTQPKARTIKFHEYKGPPNAQKNSSVSSAASTEPSYEILLQQQQLQLQWQLEWLQKNPQAVLHTTPQKRSGDQIAQVSPKAIQNNQGQQQQQQQQQQPQQQLFDAPSSPQKLLSKLEDMKVSDLKTELKKRNLPVSGSKPLLIERLKSYSELPQASTNSTASSNNVTSQQLNVNQLLDNLNNSIPTDIASSSISSVEGGMDTIKSLLNSTSSNSRPPSAISLDVETTNGLEIPDTLSDSSSTSFTNEDIVQLQQRFIEKLQRELERSQLQLQQSKNAIISQFPSVQTIGTSAINAKTSVHAAYSDATSTAPSTSTSSTNGDHAETPPSAESKSLQRQIIHQYLQQKIQHQQLQQRLLQEAQKKQATLTSSSSEPPSTNPNSTLTALLESRPMNASPTDLDAVTEVVTSFVASANEQDSNRTNSISGSEYQGVIAIETPTDSGTAGDLECNDYPGVIPIDNSSENGDLESPFDVVSPLMVNINGPSDNETSIIPASNGISSRSSSLPSFSALVSCKPSPTRSNTDPQFVITRPPPDYNEATRQLNKVKQQLKSEDGNACQSKVLKSSLKNQMVEDVLEILIKNGELHPSAVQDPNTPVPPISETDQVPIFTSNNDVFFSKPMSTTSLVSTAMTTVAKDHSPDLHMSLQSVLELTPPSSAGFGDAGSAPTSSLDFDFSLDMPEIEGMDLESLDNPPQNAVTSDLNLTSTVKSSTKPCIEYLHSSNNNDVTPPSHIMRTAGIVGLHQDRGTDRSMDMDLIEWLEVLEETSAASSNSSNFHHPPSYDHDPLFSTSAHETLDLFGGDDIDFKPQTDLNFLPWGDKTDFTT